MGRLDGKTAIVTGAGGGIGRAICTRFAVEGAAVVCIDINTDTVTETATRIQNTGGRAVALSADVSEESTAEAAAERARDDFGNLSVLVNNAVHDLPLAPLTEISLEDWRRTMDVNLNGAFLMSKHAIPIMAESGGGSIIHIASQLGYTAKPGRTWYCAQKAALINLARAMALDHARQNIRVNSLSPVRSRLDDLSATSRVSRRRAPPTIRYSTGWDGPRKLLMERCFLPATSPRS